MAKLAAFLVSPPLFRIAIIIAGQVKAFCLGLHEHLKFIYGQ
jgi:hypothetical protein